MTIEEVMSKIMDSDPVEGWEHTRRDMSGYTIVLKDDVNIRIENDSEADVLNGNYVEPWANKHANPKASSNSFRIYYGPSLVASVPLVSVDGGRARLPMPNPQTMSPDALHFRIAEIINYNGAHEYAQRSGFNSLFDGCHYSTIFMHRQVMVSLAISRD